MGTNIHHPASLPQISEYSFTHNVEFFNRIDEKPPAVQFESKAA